jgi:hypothetical protein
MRSGRVSSPARVKIVVLLFLREIVLDFHVGVPFGLFGLDVCMAVLLLALGGLWASSAAFLASCDMAIVLIQLMSLVISTVVSLNHSPSRSHLDAGGWVPRPLRTERRLGTFRVWLVVEGEYFHAR